MQIDRTITNNIPDIIIHDNGKGACVLVEVVTSAGRKVMKKEAQ
jgi:hypothetical protein